MQEVMIKGKKKLAFVVTDGEAAKVVIPVDYLTPVDYRRLSQMEAKGGELMSVMRETRVDDNGVNALVLYQNLLVTVEKEPEVKSETKAEAKTESDDTETDGRKTRRTSSTTKRTTTRRKKTSE